MRLTDIVRGTWLKDFATATPATFATHGREDRPSVAKVAVANPWERSLKAPSVASVATVAVANPVEQKPVCPNDQFKSRRDRLRRAGLADEDAALMAFKLERRDMEGDDRRLCLECRYLLGGGVWRCAQWKQRQESGPEIPGDLVSLVLHRCAGFENRMRTTK